MTLLICCPPLLAVMRVRCLRLSSRISCPECTVSTPMPYVPASAFTITKGGLSMSYSAYLRWIFWISVSTLRATQSSPSHKKKKNTPHGGGGGAAGRGAGAGGGAGARAAARGGGGGAGGR